MVINHLQVLGWSSKGGGTLKIKKRWGVGVGKLFYRSPAESDLEDEFQSLNLSFFFFFLGGGAISMAVKNKKPTRWFKVTFWSPSWRSLNHPKEVTKNCQVDCFFLERFFFITHSVKHKEHEIAKKKGIHRNKLTISMGDGWADLSHRFLWGTSCHRWYSNVPGSELPLFPYNRGWSSTQY